MRLVLAAILALAAAPAVAQPALEVITVALPNFTFTFTSTFIADELGLWAKHGLKAAGIVPDGNGQPRAWRPRLTYDRATPRRTR